MSAEDTGTDHWALVRAVGEDLERCSARLADPGATWTEADAEQVDALVMVLEDLRARAPAAPDGDDADDGATSRGSLAALYEAPVSSAAPTAALDELLRRASLAQEQAWQRAGRPIPAFRRPTPILAKEVVVAPVGVGLVALADLDGQPADARVATDIMEVPLDSDDEAAVTADGGTAATAEGAAPDVRRVDRWAVAVEVLTVVGVLAFVFVVYVVYGTGLSGAQSQELLERDFRADLRASVALGSGSSEQESGMLGDEDDTAAQQDATAEEPASVAPGDPVAVLSLPTIGSRTIVVEGTRSDDLTAGPGHLRSTPALGQAGNSVVFGRRTTYGGPFADLEDLRPGDPMDVVTTQGAFRYVVQEVRRVGPGEPDPITSTFSNRLTLVTSDERYASEGRLVAIGLLDGPPVATPTGADGRMTPLPIVNPDELGTERTGVDWALAILWTQLLAIAYFGTRWLYAHWMPWSTWLVTAPVFLVIGFAWLDSLARLFPSTL